MSSKEILRLLQKGEITLEKAKAELAKIKRLELINSENSGYSSAKDELPVGNNILTPVWDVETIEIKDFIDVKEHLLIIGGTKENHKDIKLYYSAVNILGIKSEDTVNTIVKKIKKIDKFDHIGLIVTQNKLEKIDDESLIENQEKGVIQVFRILKALLALGYDAKDLRFSIVTIGTQQVSKDDPVCPVHAGVAGLIGSAAKEYPDWKFRFVDLDNSTGWPLEELFGLPWDVNGDQLAYRDGEWYRQRLIPVNYPDKCKTAYREGGVYVVIGGAGGIGEVWSEYMIRNYQAKIIWIGRREKNPPIQKKLDRLGTSGYAPWYLTADARDRNVLERIYKEIKQKYPEIHGVIHSAIELKDKSLAKMEEEQFREGLSTKIDVSVRIAQVFKSESLDFVLFFSSFLSYAKSAGQSNYASGCTFMDTYANILSREWKCSVKVMHWGYWGSVGSVATKEYRERMEKAGIDSIEPPEAMQTLEMLLSGPLEHIALIKTTKPQVFDMVKADELIKIYTGGSFIAVKDTKPHIQEEEPQLIILKKEELPARKKMEKLLCRLLWGLLQSSGYFTDKNVTISELKINKGVVKKYWKWLDASISILEKNAYLKQQGMLYTVKEITPVNMAEIWAEWEREKKDWIKKPGIKAKVFLAEALLRRLDKILNGDVPAIDVIFPDLSINLVEGIYRNKPVADYFNTLIGKTVAECIKKCVQKNPSTQVRIIEIGAATGSASEKIFLELKKYKQYIGEYCYTDISMAFLHHGKNEYNKEHPYLTFKIFDAEKPASEQGFETGSYDIAIVADVLRSTKNIPEMLRNTKTLLQKNGIILINEETEKSIFSHLLIGFLEGDGFYKNKNHIENLHKVLKREGFECVITPADAPERNRQILVAVNNGVVRLSRPQREWTSSVNTKTDAEAMTMESTYQENSMDPALITDMEEIREKSRRFIKNLVAETIKIPVNKIINSESMGNYGIDSIMIVRLNNRLRRLFGEKIGSTLFFEYKTIDALVEYFLKTQKNTLIRLIGFDDMKPTDEKISESSLEERSGTLLRNNNRFLRVINKGVDQSGKQSRNLEDIAIIGLSGRYAGAKNISEFWNNLKEGKNCITEIPEERWDWRKYFDEKKGKEGKVYTKWGGFIEDYDKFDPLFFKISPKEAEQMDPQERLFLEEAYSSIEDAGYKPGTLSKNNKVGVFVGVMNGNYPTGATYWSIANRLSYLFNFMGPSMAVDTACSSSLTAIHLAVEYLRSGKCECAIAGGVNLIVAPYHYIRLSALTMLSDGKECKAFGNKADGMVDGEGVGVLLLKPFFKAVNDRDHIYGVIKGSMVNSGGKTNGYTVPNPTAQSELIYDTIKNSGINARSISYIEAHGTGTSLGDPIEITGLTKAFRKFTLDKQFCAIGSVKSNIGHCEGAAGIAGVMKVVLQFKYRKLVPSLHSEDLNPDIDFSETPFIVQQELVEWKSDYPRRAGISSFGAGGANAHIIVEEFTPAKEEIGADVKKPAVIILSARNRERLATRAKDLLETIEREGYGNHELARIAYTLQTGREEMEERLGFTADNIKALQLKLKNYINEDEGISELYQGYIKQNKETLSLFTGDEDLQKAIESWIRKEKYGKLLDLWVKGLVFDWDRLYREVKPRKLSLPAYPFDRKRYWIEQENQSESRIGINRLHALLQENTSSLMEQRFSSVFNGDEFFLKDHIVNGQCVLSCAVYLEMAGAAVKTAAEIPKDTMPELSLKNVIWGVPLEVSGEPVQINIRLAPGKNNEIIYEVYCGNKDKEIVVYFQGDAEIRKAKEEIFIDVIEHQNKKWSRTFSREDCYEIFRKKGIEYGPGYMGIDFLSTSDDKALARLSMPSVIAENQEEYILHPSIMDSAFQTVICLGTGRGENKAVMPSAIDQVEIMDRCVQTMWAIIKRYNTGNEEKYDIDLCDESGKLCVRIKGLSVKEMKTGKDHGVLMLEPGWKEIALDAGCAGEEYTKHIIFLFEPDGIKIKDIENLMNGAHCIRLKPEKGKNEITERYHSYAKRMITEIQGILNSRSGGGVIIQAVVFGSGEKHLFSGLSGILKSAHLENPKIVGQLIEMDGIRESEEIVKILTENTLSGETNCIKYIEGRRCVEDLKEIKASSDQAESLWKDGGVYLITGGAGGIGRIVSRDIAEKVKGTVLIVTGRSVLHDEKKEWIEELKDKGAEVEYRQADVIRKDETERLIKSIVEEYGKLDGIIHGAGVIRDNLLVKKSLEEVDQVLSPKVRGMVNLDKASRGIKLEFFMLFSSIAGVIGNIGQADYSAANAFMDRYAKYRNEQVLLKLGYGKTVSINWPLWKEGGMKVDPESEKLIRRQFGMTAMKSENGIRALYKSVFLGKDQVIVIEGNLDRIRKKLLSGDSSEAKKTSKTVISPDAGEKREILKNVQAILVGNVSKILKVSVEDIDIENEFNDYGFDSITFTGFANILNEEFGLELNPAIFYEYTTLLSFAEYLVEEHVEVFMGKVGDVRKNQQIYHKAEETMKAGNKKSLRFNRQAFISVNTDKTIPGPVAIIGMSGIFPGAADINQFWNNLLEGKDCITEIPETRWDWKKYYGDPLEDGDKTNIKWGGFIRGVYEFDPLFFGISPREAELMDPQQRLLMTYVWKVIEDAGYSASSLSGTRTGVFIGTASSGYIELLYRANKGLEGFSGTSLTPSMGPNRMSYFLNIHGPSEPIETACSSSLVAVHRAVSAIETGSCDMAIAGGINIILTPDIHIGINKAGMLSEDGRCKTFSDKANGYVRAEGVGIVFLKKLESAERNGDHIYAVIKGTAENHGGRANSLTAPNPNAQADLLVQAYTNAGLDPRTITYIETHGTGTSLGDPIEINGLKAAFRTLYESGNYKQAINPHCGLGSVKSNIGHLELAAGIAGLIKVVLQLKHKILVKSLHCETINPYIQLKESPFYIVQEKKEWKALQDENGNDIRRRAGVSSFGFGGANAHVVIEEYVPDEVRQPVRISEEKPAIIVLSARNEERLTEITKNLKIAIEREKYNDHSLSEISFTLQIGREEMEERLGFTANTIQELEEKLNSYIEGNEGIKNVYKGQVKKNREVLSVLALDEDMEKTIDAWIEKGKYGKLVDMWVKGLAFDWNRLYGKLKPRRISLPTYSFAREVYRIKLEEEKDRDNGKSVNQFNTAESGSVFKKVYLHPLVQENTSDFMEQRFSSEFSGREFFLADHIINGQKILPGVAYLEMARTAVEAAAGSIKDEKFKISLKNVLWANPLVVGEKPVKVNIGLLPGDNKEILFEVYCEGDNGDTIIYNQGKAEFIKRKEENAIDVKKLQELKWDRILSSGDCYDVLKGSGINYGKSFRCIDVVFVNPGEALAKIKIPDHVKNTEKEYIIHPGLLDSSFQAVVCAITETENSSGNVLNIPSLPFSLEECNIYGSGSLIMWARIRYRIDCTAKTDPVKADIDLYDDKGNICIHIKGLSYISSVHLINTNSQYKSFENISNVQIQNRISEESLVEELLVSLADTLYMKPGDIDPVKKFIEIGMDSIIAMEWIKIINKKYGTKLKATILYDFPSVYDFALFMEKELNKRKGETGGKPAEQTRSVPLVLPSDLTEGLQSQTNSINKPAGIPLSTFIGEKIISAIQDSKSKPVVTLVPEENTFIQSTKQNTKMEQKKTIGANTVSEESILENLSASLADTLYMKQCDVDPDKKFVEIGMDSIIAMEWIKVINKEFGTSYKAQILYDYPSVREFSHFLKKELNLPAGEKIDKPGDQPGFVSSTDQSPLVHSSGLLIELQPLIHSPNRFLTKKYVKKAGGISRAHNNELTAIIGMSGRYPDAENLEQFWENLSLGKNSIKEIPISRWDMTTYYDPRPSMAFKGKIYCKWMGMLDNIEYFDPLFFNISPAEAEVMDPQHRLFIQEGYKAFEDAGYNPQLLNNKKCGVYMGIMSNEYGMMLFKNQTGGANITGNSFAIAAARIPYFLNLKGPAIPIDTACSSSLVATYLACQALGNYEIDMALVGGVTLYLTPQGYVGMCAAGMLSPEGKCKVFDDGADGFVPGEGVGALVLKRLHDAERDKDHIYGLIIGAGINQDGKTNGITAPSMNSQMELEREVYKKNNIEPESIGYVEMHGTGTKLGDPIELEALSAVFREGTNKKNYCAIGSVKSNIGHISAAAGVAGIHKVLLCMNNKKLVPTLNYKNPNENFDFKDSPFYVNTELKTWQKISNTPLRAGVSSFGFSGTNSHIVIQEYIPDIKRENPYSLHNSPGEELFIFSAKNEKQLKRYAESIRNWLESQNNINLLDMAYTLQTGRGEMEYRLAFPADSKEFIIKALTSFITNDPCSEMFFGEIKNNKKEAKIADSADDTKLLLKNWIHKRKLKKLAESWVKGININWEQLYVGFSPYRISLPTYPFAKEKYWIPIKNKMEGSVITDIKQMQNKENIILKKEWQQKDIREIDNYIKGLVVVLGTKSTFKLVKKLFKGMKDIQVIPVIHGKLSKKGIINTDFYSVQAGETLYQQIIYKKHNDKFLGVVDVTALDASYEDSLEIESGKIRFIQLLIENNRNEGYTLLGITYKLNYFQVETTTMQGARLAGLYRMLGAEYRQIESVTMDSDNIMGMNNKLLHQIQTEFLNRDRGNLSECCYRNGVRYEPRLTIEKTNKDIAEFQIEDRDIKYKKDEVVIISGGSRGIGAAIAEQLVSHGVKNLAIMGREELPGYRDWKTILEKKSKPEIMEKIRKMQDYINRGVKVRYFNTSLSDEAGLAGMIKEIHENLGLITGVIHCAGLVNKDPAFFKKEIPAVEKVCGPKMKGLVTLHKALAREPLSFFILFSSISTIVPTLATGQSDYAMANSYMDFYAMHQEREGKRYIKSIQWPAWGEVGMAADTQGVQTQAYRNTGLVSLTTKDGLKFLDIIRKIPVAVSAPCTIIPDEFNIKDLLKNEISCPDKKIYTTAAEPGVKTKSSAVPANDRGVDLKTATIKWLKDIFMAELKLIETQIEEEKSFDEYGVDSIVIAQLVPTLKEQVKIPISPSLLIENRTLDDLSDYFIANHEEELRLILGIKHKIAGEDVNQYTESTVDAEEQTPFIFRPVRTEDHIAVVGLSCRFPGAPSKEAYWDLLTRGMSAIKPVPKKRWITKNDRIDYGGWIDDIDLFDHEFFKITDNDAAIMDPQARVILEESLHAICDAGYEYKELSGRKIGIYVGGRSQLNMNLNTVLQSNNPILGVGQNYLATNISRFFNFTGPSIVIDTACSSGLTAISMAMDGLKDGRIDTAIIGAVSLLLNPFVHEMFAVRNILSKNGEFHIFDKQAGGEVLGEGVGTVVLKRLKDAVRDGNQIYGVINAIAVNNDGRTLGPGSPNMNSQKKVIQEAIIMSGEKIEDVGYIEVNGGGSPVMDSVEIKVLSEIYELNNPGLKPCAVGSIKPNVGHLLIASGLAGFIRCILSLYYKQIPPFLSAKDPVDYYDFKGSRILFNRESIDWDVEPGKKRIAVQNSFPDGGTNCHIIMEEFDKEREYEQRYFPKPVPEMHKKSFIISPAVLQEKTELSTTGNGMNINDLKKKFMIKQINEFSKHNIWGITR